jgi:methylated-DNA-[protein]-cysteine S-methyltransferase
MFYTILDFPLGKIFLAKSERGLSLASSLKNRNRFEEITEFFKRKSILLELQRKKFHREEKLFSQYFEGKKEDFTSLPLDFISGTPYQRKVWLETRKIPYGKTQTYKFLAKKLNHRGYRSIGQALSRNPLLIVIPCHRVISSDGSIGGFTGGLELKKFLLRLEKP